MGSHDGDGLKAVKCGQGHFSGCEPLLLPRTPWAELFTLHCLPGRHSFLTPARGPGRWSSPLLCSALLPPQFMDTSLRPPALRSQGRPLSWPATSYQRALEVSPELPAWPSLLHPPPQDGRNRSRGGEGGSVSESGLW